MQFNHMGSQHIMKFFSRALLLSTLSLTSLYSSAEEVDDSPKKEGLDYISYNVIYLDFHGMNGSESASNKLSTFTMGTYITDYVKVETRLGVGMVDDTLSGVKVLKDEDGNSVTDEQGNTVIVDSNADFTIDYFFSWYMGMHYPLAEWSSVYFQLGASFVDGSITAEEGSTYEEISDEFLSSRFSMSWLAGFDFEITEDWYATLEAGRLHRGSQSDIDLLHYGLGIKYEF